MLILSYFSLREFRGKFETELESYHQFIASSKVAEIDFLLLNFKRQIEWLSKNPILSDGKSETSVIQEQFESAKKAIPVLDDLSLIDLHGNVLVSTDYRYVGEWSKKDWYLKALNGEEVFSEVHTIPDPLRTVMVFCAPVRNSQNEIKAVVAAQLDMTGIWNILSEVLPHPGGLLVMADENNRIIYHPAQEYLYEDLASELKQEPISWQKLTYHERGEDYKVNFAVLKDEKNLRGKHWKIFVFHKVSALDAVYNSFRSIVILATLSTMALMMVMGVILSLFLTRPLGNLMRGVQKIGEGDLKYKIKINSRDELGLLAKEVNNMGGKLRNSETKLKKYYRDLEKEVAERTAEIQEKNKELVKWQKVTVDRELKMVELKKELKKHEKKD